MQTFINIVLGWTIRTKSLDSLLTVNVRMRLIGGRLKILLSFTLYIIHTFSGREVQMQSFEINVCILDLDMWRYFYFNSFNNTTGGIFHDFIGCWYVSLPPCFFFWITKKIYHSCQSHHSFSIFSYLWYFLFMIYVLLTLNKETTTIIYKHYGQYQSSHVICINIFCLFVCFGVKHSINRQFRILSLSMKIDLINDLQNVSVIFYARSGRLNLMWNRSDNSKTNSHVPFSLYKRSFALISWKLFDGFTIKSSYSYFEYELRTNVCSECLVFSVSVLAHIIVHMSHNHEIFSNSNWIGSFAYPQSVLRHRFVIIIILIFCFIFSSSYSCFSAQLYFISKIYIILQ